MSGLSLDDLLSLEQQGWHSLWDSRGDTFYGSLMTTDALMIRVNGMVMDRGPASADVLITVRELCRRFPDRVTALVGNHDD